MNEMTKKAKAIVENKIIPSIKNKGIIEISIELDREDVFPITLVLEDKEKIRFNVKNKSMSMAIMSELYIKTGERA